MKLRGPVGRVSGRRLSPGFKGSKPALSVQHPHTTETERLGKLLKTIATPSNVSQYQIQNHYHFITKSADKTQVL